MLEMKSSCTSWMIDFDVIIFFINLRFVHLFYLDNREFRRIHYLEVYPMYHASQTESDRQ